MNKIRKRLTRLIRFSFCLAEKERTKNAQNQTRHKAKQNTSTRRAPRSAQQIKMHLRHSKVGSRKCLWRKAQSESNLTAIRAVQSFSNQSCSSVLQQSSFILPRRSTELLGIPVDKETGSHIIMTGETPLHLALHEQPSVTIINKLIEDYPDRVSQHNIIGMTPLYIAAASGANPLVIDCLSKHFPQALTIQDHKGRTPLHLMCMYSGDCDTGNSYGDKVKGPFLPSLKVLIDGPNTSFLNLEDHFGRSALEYALDSDASIHVIKALHRASEEVWKKQKACMIGKKEIVTVKVKS